LVLLYAWCGAHFMVKPHDITVSSLKKVKIFGIVPENFPGESF